MSEETGVAAVDRALSILAAFSPNDRSLTLTQIAERTGLYKSTVLRLIESLARAHYLVRITDGSYQIGPKPLQLGAIFQRQFHTSEYVPPCCANSSPSSVKALPTTCRPRTAASACTAWTRRA